MAVRTRVPGETRGGCGRRGEATSSSAALSATSAVCAWAEVREGEESAWQLGACPWPPLASQAIIAAALPTVWAARKRQRLLLAERRTELHPSFPERAPRSRCAGAWGEGRSAQTAARCRRGRVEATAAAARERRAHHAKGEEGGGEEREGVLHRGGKRVEVGNEAAPRWLGESLDHPTRQGDAQCHESAWGVGPRR